MTVPPDSVQPTDAQAPEPRAAQVEPSASLASRAKAAAEAAKSTSESLTKPKAPRPNSPAGITEPLQRLLLIRPMTSYFQWLARREHPKLSQEERILAMRNQAPHLYAWCVWTDFVFQGAGTVALFILTIAVAVKAIT